MPSAACVHAGKGFRARGARMIGIGYQQVDEGWWLRKTQIVDAHQCHVRSTGGGRTQPRLLCGYAPTSVLGSLYCYMSTAASYHNTLTTGETMVVPHGVCVGQLRAGQRPAHPNAGLSSTQYTPQARLWHICACQDGNGGTHKPCGMGSSTGGSGTRYMSDGSTSSSPLRTNKATSP